jgi:hypothetical protein
MSHHSRWHVVTPSTVSRGLTEQGSRAFVTGYFDCAFGHHAAPVHNHEKGGAQDTHADKVGLVDAADRTVR